MKSSRLPKNYGMAKKFLAKQYHHHHHPGFRLSKVRQDCLTMYPFRNVANTFKVNPLITAVQKLNIPWVVVMEWIFITIWNR